MLKQYLLWAWKISLIIAAPLFAFDLYCYYWSVECPAQEVIHYLVPGLVILSAVSLYLSRRVTE